MIKMYAGLQPAERAFKRYTCAAIIGISFKGFFVSGWVKLHRRLLDWEWYDDHNTLRLFVHLLLTCNYEPDTWRGKTIGIGQRIIGRKKLANEAGFSEQQIRTSLRNLQSTNDITIKSTNEYSLITIVKWIDYQDINQQTNQQTTTIKEIKKERNKERSKETNPKIHIPDWLPDSAWKDLCDYRSTGKGKFTDKAKQLAIGKLKTFMNDGNDPTEVINQTIMNGWSGLFAIKGENNANNQGRTAKPNSWTEASEQLGQKYEREIRELEEQARFEADAGEGLYLAEGIRQIESGD